VEIFRRLSALKVEKAMVMKTFCNMAKADARYARASNNKAYIEKYKLHELL
jgi:hypothetical protein